MQYSIPQAKKYMRNWQDKYPTLPESYTIGSNVYYHGIDDENIFVLIRAPVIDDSVDISTDLLLMVSVGLPCPDWCSNKTILTV